MTGLFCGVNCFAGFLAAGLFQCMHNQQVYIIHLLMNSLMDVDITCGVCFSNIARESITFPIPLSLYRKFTVWGFFNSLLSGLKFETAGCGT